MTMTVNITLRIPDNLAPLFDQAAGHDSLSRHAWIIQALTEAVAPDSFDPAVVIGFVALAGGELNNADCPECAGPMQKPHVGFVAGKHRPLSFGPVCGLCATAE